MIRFGRFTVGSWSTFGQTALLLFAALFLAQVFAIYLMRAVIDQWQSSYVEQPTISRFAEVAQQVQSVPAARRDQILYATSQSGEQFWLARDILFGSSARRSSLEVDLSLALKKRGIGFSAVVASRGGRFGGFLDRRLPALGPEVGKFFRGLEPPPGPDDRAWPATAGSPPAGADPPGSLLQGPQPGPDHARQSSHLLRGWGPGGFHPGRMNDEIRLAALLPSGDWLVGRFWVQKPVPLLFNPIVISQIALFVMLLGASLFWASRISRPLRILARAAEVLRPQERFTPIAVKGPRDVQVAITSFNAMAQRVYDLLQEKDHMLSAIGHDLRTPLASLRIRAETIEPEGDRERFIESIDEMTKMVEEILGLARLGHSSEPRQLVDLSALADSIVEEFRALGKDVTFAESSRTPIEMQVGPVRRILRNLIDNAVKYGEKAQVSVLSTVSSVEFCVEDEGPGIPPEKLSEVLRPFTRLEHSRSRRTGGIGLGLSIANAIAQSQGADLILHNRSSGGLRAIVKWTRPPP